MEWLSTFTEHPLWTSAITIISCYTAYYLILVVKRPALACRESPWLEFLHKNMPILQEYHWPTPWCFEGRLQSVIMLIVRFALPDICYERETLTLKDSGIISIDWLGKPNRSDQPIIIILPGLTGSSQTDYVKGFVTALRDVDVCCVVFNHRGQGGTDLKTTRTYCKANCDDFEEAVEHIHALYPNAPMMATGVSLGGMLVTNYLATRGEKAAKHLVAGVAFSVPWNMFLASESLATPFWNVVFDYALIFNLRRQFMKYRPILQRDDYPWDFDHVMKSKSMKELDSRFTAINFGFKDVDHYYRSASLDDKLENIRVPYLCLNAADDFFQPVQGVPMEKVPKSSHVAIAVTSRGGHVGFLEGLFPRKTCYSDRMLRQFVQGVISNLDKVRSIKQEGDKYAQRPSYGKEY